MPKMYKLIYKLISVVQILASITLLIFLIINWKYIANPHLLERYYDAQAVFSYGRDGIAKYRHILFYYPFAIFPYLIYLQSVLLTFLLIKKHLVASKQTWILIFGVMIFIIFSDAIFNNLAILLKSNYHRKAGNGLNDMLGTLVFFAFFLLPIISTVLLVKRKLIKYRKVFYLNISTISIYILYIISFIDLFFD